MPPSRPTMLIGSPYRKRESSDSGCDSPPASYFSPASIASHQEARLLEEEDLGRHSPRAAVAGRLGALAIHSENNSSLSNSDASLHKDPFVDSLRTKCWVDSYTGLHDMAENTSTEPSDFGSNGFSEENDHLHNANSAASASTSASIVKEKSLSSPRKRKATSGDTPRMCHKQGSPSPDSTMEDNSLTWNDSEITGHDPNDPNDDGYGINGIGFKPTAAIAWARAQKRQRQVAEWKSREAREAREKRREKRDGHGFDKLRSIQSGTIQKRVKFNL
ncbi:hypothetical protein KXX16_003264 [Aspergillus fumigatus]|uniref:Uncharacterized protein n=3 Tax=Aspergillus fumigatus TaxID=746128 RepID=Q4WXI0_ASPFU|nr:hypothetical protein AFUA_3G09580 [Aspergillus fumigatus Af293]EDP52790.1 hypothetical protein AFUB_039590 [Aspergillus fumigatus A1163]KAF4257770.1 hypothetical protein CNMCM8057_003503 [Aspergillus fumigatus]EAL92623.1 hypothetical protein AFUA_3G09580 [Aspergillus fumigatus Af293]KAF4279605.1 hypothetical protein CNMCM8689_003217 [Aspergillus fumigatus]KAF4288265.1 hypothetical protein CNMCM8686_003841 [Aspergillus fumigatus]